MDTAWRRLLMHTVTLLTGTLLMLAVPTAIQAIMDTRITTGELASAGAGGVAAIIHIGVTTVTAAMDIEAAMGVTGIGAATATREAAAATVDIRLAAEAEDLAAAAHAVAVVTAAAVAVTVK